MGLDQLYDCEMRSNQTGRNVEKDVLVMKCNKSINIPYYVEYLTVNTG